MDWVLDASFTLKLNLPDETSHAATETFIAVSSNANLWVPCLWWYEITNGVVVAERRGRLIKAEAEAVLEQISSLPVHTDFESGPSAVKRLKTLSQEFRLSAYDAAYLELADRLGAGLFTVDQPLIAAAKGLHVRILSS